MSDGIDTKMVQPVAKRRPPAAGMGRKPGQLNKTTRAVKEALQEAFEELGGVPALVRFAHAEPGEFYKLWAKLLPTEVNANLVGGITLTMAPGDERL